MSSDFNEATRVQLPAMVHLTRLGYQYFGKLSVEDRSGEIYDPDTNILTKVFTSQFDKLNPQHTGEGVDVLRRIRQELDYDDLGMAFYKRLKTVSPIKLIDFENIDNNTFHFTAEFTCKNGDDEFRPDITLFVNGMPLCFIEVKKPNNEDGMVAESTRMNDRRFPNKKFRRFINITELMIFSNNMEYDTLDGIVPVEGAFYCTGATNKASFNCFREENKLNEPIAPYNRDYPYEAINPEIEKRILSDFNCQVLHTAKEYQINLDINTPTNRIITSMCSKERLLFILRYGIAFVNMQKEDAEGNLEIRKEKHIIRYQQLFAALAVLDKLSDGITSGVIWHTQGSGKTALSYYLTYVLSDYYARQNKVAKFYFIVDRIDLLKQASEEFAARGLTVKTANSRAELMNQFRDVQAREGNDGSDEIVVVNIQRFAEDHNRVVIPSYATNLQRVFIIDEAHRGYNPKGSFLANLFDADRNAIKIALTGTPLLKQERESWKVFGNYIHTYYYDKSIQDGYTLKIIREDIETMYRENLSKIYNSLETLVEKKSLKKEDIIEHERYVSELARYIITDFVKFRMLIGDNTVGGMVICETSQQARVLYGLFNRIQNELNAQSDGEQKYALKVALILYDSDDKETQEKIIYDYKQNNTYDILIVYNMLLTGFDAKRLKRLYFGRKLRDHNLLQALTRVNRPYKDIRYGYVIDFADIKKNFDETNEQYLKELNRFNDPDETGVGNNTPAYLQMLEDKEAIKEKLRELRQVLFDYSLENAESCSSQISTLEDRSQLKDVRDNLMNLRDYFNIIRTFGDDELKEFIGKFDISHLPDLIREVNRRMTILYQKELFKNSDVSKQLINEAMMQVSFSFQLKSTEEMNLTIGQEELTEKYRNTIAAFMSNIDHEDPEYITLKEAFLLRLKEHGFSPTTAEEVETYSKELDEVIKKLNEIKMKNRNLMSKYKGDVKFARTHKRIVEENKERAKEHKAPIISKYDLDIVDSLMYVKESIDQSVYDRNDILKKDAYFDQNVMSLLSRSLKEHNIGASKEDRDFLQKRISNEYLSQYRYTYD